MATNDDDLDGPPPNRNADEYDDLFFVPATTPTSEGMSPQSQYRPSYDADSDNDSDYNYNENSGGGNFFDDDYVHDREESRSSQPTKHSTQQQSKALNQQQQYTHNQRNNYRATGIRQQQQPQGEYSQQFQSGGIPSTRALYQFRPLQTGSTRQMPPTVSYYDSYGDDYNVEEDQESYTNFAEQNNVSFLDDADEPVVKRSAKIITKDADKEVVVNEQVSVQSQNPKPASQKETESKHVSLDDISKVSAAAAANTSQIYPSRTPRNFSPSFMEPPKVKVIKNDKSGKADSNTPRKIPVEASTGNVSTQYIDTLTQQLEHLSAQIYELNDGIEFNIGSPKQVAKVLFGEDDQGSSTNKDVLEAMASAGNVMAENIYKWRKVSSQKKRELKRIEQMEKGDRKNDYYGNLARRDTRQNNSADTKKSTKGIEESTQGNDQVEFFETIEEQDEAPPVKETVSNRETLLLIDASAYIFRSYHAMPPLHRADGLPTGALHGVCRLLQSLLLSQLLKGDRPRVVLVFDSKGDNFRHELYPEYKANRGPCPEDLIPQFDLVKEAASAFGILQVEAEGYEADDVIATLSRMALDVGMNVDIMSSDKDLWQLVTPPNAEPRLYMVDPLNFSAISHDDVVQKWGVSADKLADLLALAGDASDNIKGAPGIGPKIAAQLLNEYGSLSDLFANIDKIKQKKRRESLDASVEEVMLFRQLVALDDTIPTERMTMSSQSFQCVSSVRMPTFDPSKLLDFYERMELKACKNDLERKLRSSWVHYKQPPTPAEFSDVPF